MYINWINYGYTGNSCREYSDVLRIVNTYLGEINYDSAPYRGIAKAFVDAELVTKDGGNYVFTGRRTPSRVRDLALLPELVTRLANEMELTWQGASPMGELLSQFRPSGSVEVHPYLDPDKLRIAKVFLERIG